MKVLNVFLLVFLALKVSVVWLLIVGKVYLKLVFQIWIVEEVMEKEFILLIVSVGIIKTEMLIVMCLVEMHLI